MPVMVHIFKGKRDGGELLSRADQDRADVDLALARLIPWYFNDDDMLLKIFRDEVTRWVAGGPMSHLGIGLVGPGHPILPVVVYLLPPSAQCTDSQPAHHHDTHSSPSPGKPTETGSLARYTGSCSCWRHLDHAVILYRPRALW